MPAKNSVKIYLEDVYYHIYNRGTGKSNIFLDEQDYKVFLHYLKKYLDQTSEYSLADKVKLLAYCLMPNHFHLFVYQITKEGLIKLMRALSTSYAMYFNKKYDRSGTIFQGIYKAVLVENEPYFLHITRYIHLNPAELTENWEEYPYSSYGVYLGKNKIPWVDPSPVLAFFKEDRRQSSIFSKYFSYESFVEEYPSDSKMELGELSID